jgi:DNA end-binding protein Ku
MAEKEIEIAIMLIDQLSTPFKPEDFKDTFSEEIKKIIEEKVKTGKISSIEQSQAEKPAEVIDLLAKLKLSLEEAKKKNAS